MFCDPPIIHQKLSSDWPRRTAQDGCVSGHAGWSSTAEIVLHDEENHTTQQRTAASHVHGESHQHNVSSCPRWTHLKTRYTDKYWARSGSETEIEPETSRLQIRHDILTKTCVHKRPARSVAQCRTTLTKIEDSNLQWCSLQGSLSRNTTQRHRSRVPTTCLRTTVDKMMMKT